MAGCSGQDLGRKKPEEVVSYAPCPRCNQEIEFWFDELRGRCPSCKYLVEKQLAQILKDYGCALWCKTALNCIGEDAYGKVEEFKQTLEKEKGLEKKF